MSEPEKVVDPSGRLPGESPEAWFKRVIGPIPTPTPDMDARKEPDATSSKRHDALGALERTIPPAYQWSRFSAPELPMRVAPSAIAQAQASWRDPRVCLMGVSRAGKTSLAVAMLRQWVRSSERSAAFLRAYKLAGARLRHPAGHGEPEIVELALKAPLVLIDDLGCERDSPTNAVVDVIFERHDDGLPTWVTTGLTREQLLARYGLGVVARIFERARVVRVGEGGRVRAGPERCGE